MHRKKESSIETKTVHAGEPSPRINGAVVMPIFQSAMFEYAGEKKYDDIRYIRLNNTPNHKALAEKLAQLENAEDALVTSSGMAAISTTLLTLLANGDHLLAQDCLYGGTHDFVTKDLEKFGISYDFINGNEPDSWEGKLKPRTKAIYVETVSNPLMGVPDLEAVVEFARSHKLVSVIDNTFASPVNFRPPELGFDLSLHSATKYLNGHSDIVAGAVIGGRGLVEKITHRLNHLVGSLDTHAAFILHRGMKTLSIRVKHQNASALRIAQFLESHPSVAQVNYPGLDNHPQLNFFFQAEDGIRDRDVTGVQTCALPIWALAGRLHKWIEGGRYATLFDNLDDTLTVEPLQVFDFEAMRTYPELLEPLLFYVLHRKIGRASCRERV